MKLEDHPTVKRLGLSVSTGPSDQAVESTSIDASWLRDLARDSGAEDVGLVELERDALDPQRNEILRHYPWTRTLLSFVVRMAREPVRGAPRSVANLEFHRAGHAVNEISSRIVTRLEEGEVRAVNPSMGFPMEMYQHPGHAIWIVSHKPIAVAAGLGHMGIHRNLIHPKFGNFVLLGTVLIDRAATDYDRPIDYNPCLECKLCVAACPVGAIGPDGSFNFQACFTHNYREFLGGFTDWVEQIADARDALDYRRRINEPETASMWQSLTYGANYKSAYCMAVCPAGEDVIGPYLRDKKQHVNDFVRPLQERSEPVYVVEGTDAEALARRKWKNKQIKPVGAGLNPRTIDGMLTFMPFVFQPTRSRGLNAVFHFIFTGAERRQATITIKDHKLEICDGLIGKSDMRVVADAKTWLGFLAKEKSLSWALVTRKIRPTGDPRLLLAFGKCFPSTGVRHKQTEVLPQPSLLKRENKPYQRNDAATGRIRWQGSLTLKETEQVTHSVKTFRFINPDGGDIPFRHVPGQFLTLNIKPNGIPTRRSYTIASPPSWQDRIEITVKREPHGLVSRWLHDVLTEGDRVDVEAPNGSFVFSGTDAGSIVLIGGGVGITPMMSIARYLTETDWPGTTHLLLGFRTPADFIFRDEIEDLKLRNANLRVAVAMSQPGDQSWSGYVGHVDANLLKATVQDIVVQQAHICGPPAMMDAVKATLHELGVPPHQIKTEAFGTIKRDPTAKAKKSGAVIAHVTFQNSNVTAPVPAGATLLDVADNVDVFIDNACRSGTCSSCRVKLKAGKVRMFVEDALSDDEKQDGYILTCQAEAETDVVLEA